MTSPNTTTSTGPSTSTSAGTSTGSEKTRSGLSAVQVAASALAAVSSAVLLSFLGVAGTLIGAALASVVSTVGASLYSSSLQKTNERLRRRVRPERPAADRPLPSYLDPRRAPAPRSRVRWGRVPLYAAAVFAVAMGVITGVELIGQKPVSAMVTQSSSTGTTLGDVGHAPSSRSTSTDPTDGTTDGTTTDAPASPTTTAPATSTSSAPTRATSTGEDDDTASPSSTGSARSSAAPTRSAAPMTVAPTTAAAPTS